MDIHVMIFIGFGFLMVFLKTTLLERYWLQLHGCCVGLCSSAFCSKAGGSAS